MYYSHSYTVVISGEPATELHNDPYSNGDSHCYRHIIALSGEFTTYLDTYSDRYPNINTNSDGYTITLTDPKPNTH